MSKGFHVRPSVFFRDRSLHRLTISFFETGIFNPLRTDPRETFTGLGFALPDAFFM